jgi:hypothetical protein
MIEKDQIFKCSTCGATSPGNPMGACGCGTVVKGVKGRPFRCAPNPRVCYESPAEYVICLAGTPAVSVKG